MKLSINKAILIAKEIMRETAYLKDWRLRSKQDKELRDIAGQIVKGKGYIFGTEREVLEQYGRFLKAPFVVSTERPRIWTIQADITSCRNGRKSLSIICVR